MTKTKKEMFTAMLALEAVQKDIEMVEFIRHEIDLLNKKSSAPKKPTLTQTENKAFLNDIATALAEVETPQTITEIQALVPAVAELSNQRVSHILNDAVKAGTLTKSYIKKKAYFTVA